MTSGLSAPSGGERLGFRVEGMDCASCVGKIETALNNLIDGLQDLVAAHNETANAVGGIVTGVNSVVTKVNSINQTTAGLRSALLDQGHIT